MSSGLKPHSFDSYSALCRRFMICTAAMLAALAVVPAIASMPRVFGDNMVLQRETPVPIWGTGEPGEAITVALSRQPVTTAPHEVVLTVAQATTKADNKGHWMVRLAAMPAGGPYVLNVAAKEPSSFKNVMLGEVWICSGQSNMAMTVNRSKDAEKEVAAADHPDIRLFTVKMRTSSMPANDVESDGWQTCKPQTVGEFSAVGYFFGRELHEKLLDRERQDKLHVPIGLINTSWGGTAIEPWTPPVGFALVPKLQQYADQIEQADREYIKSLSDYLDSRQSWINTVKQSGGKTEFVKPPLPEHPTVIVPKRTSSTIYNAMVDPLVPYAIAGAIWYQGESNCSMGDGLLYADKMKALIDGWRTVWNQGEFPFYYVQIAPWGYKAAYPGDENRLPLLWQAQLMSLSLPKTGMAVISDVGNIKDIHPTNKQEVGRRLALWALAKTYDEESLVYSGPLYKSMVVEDNKIRIKFRSVGTGLVSRDGKPLTWFQIAGEDHKFVDATASIDGDALVVSNDQVDKPVAVRFAWNELAEPNLMNKEGLPASPFRTDSW